MQSRAAQFFDRSYDQVVRRLPGKVAASLDWRRPAYLHSFGGPLNGQSGRQQIVRDLLIGVGGFAQLVETGTFRGASTEFFAHLTPAQIFTTEASLRYYEFARRRLVPYDTVHLNLGDSRPFLRDLGGSKSARTFFYLDAHWEEDLPLAEEMQIILQSWPNSVTLIDDFEVPDDPGYTFDDYGPGKRLCADYLGALPVGWRLFYPAVRSEDETGAKRGCGLVVSPELVGEVEKLSTLRAAT